VADPDESPVHGQATPKNHDVVKGPLDRPDREARPHQHGLARTVGVTTPGGYCIHSNRRPLLVPVMARAVTGRDGVKQPQPQIAWVTETPYSGAKRDASETTPGASTARRDADLSNPRELVSSGERCSNARAVVETARRFRASPPLLFVPREVRETRPRRARSTPPVGYGRPSRGSAGCNRATPSPPGARARACM